jgi:hypothetical protein
VVSVTDPYGRILGFLDRSRYFSIKYNVEFCVVGGGGRSGTLCWIPATCSEPEDTLFRGRDVLQSAVCLSLTCDDMGELRSQSLSVCHSYASGLGLPCV